MPKGIDLGGDPVSRFVEAQKSLVIQHSDFSLRALSDMAKDGAIQLDPAYQRRDRWKPERQSALIESFILNVPVPPVYLSEDDFGKYSVIDGKQRITAIRDFLSGALKLKQLKKFSELEGFHFKDLPSQIQNALSVRPYIRVITLLKQTNPQLKYEVFLRLNTGGEQLLAQEIRNVAFSGPLNDLLQKLSRNQFLWDRLKIKNNSAPSYRKMDDVEHVLRFFTLRDRWERIGQLISGEMDSFMDQYRHAPEAKLEELSSSFARSIHACERIWGKHAFYKPKGNQWRAQFISPLFDAEMVAADTLDNAALARAIKNRESIIKNFVKKFNEDIEFSRSVNQSTNNPSSIRRRIQTVRDLLRG